MFLYKYNKENALKIKGGKEYINVDEYFTLFSSYYSLFREQVVKKNLIHIYKEFELNLLVANGIDLDEYFYNIQERYIKLGIGQTNWKDYDLYGFAELIMMYKLGRAKYGNKLVFNITEAHMRHLEALQHPLASDLYMTTINHIANDPINYLDDFSSNEELKRKKKYIYESLNSLNALSFVEL